jgi:small subunit ribosomal protein S8
MDRISKPGRRVYIGADEIPSVMDGLGISILSTSKGIMSNSKAKDLNIGGELLIKVW